MARLDPARQDVIDGIADEILHDHAHGRVIVAIDAEDIAAADAFGTDLVGLLKKRGYSAFAARMNDFVAARDRREAFGAPTGETVYRSTYDLSVLRRVLIDPFRMGGSTGFVAAHYDRVRERQIEPKWLTAPDDAILVLSGEFLQRPELRALWSFTVWLDSTQVEPVDAVVAAARKLYAKDAKPRESASAIVDLTLARGTPARA